MGDAATEEVAYSDAAENLASVIIVITSLAVDCANARPSCTETAGDGPGR